MQLHPLREHRRVLAAALVGTVVEHYDFFLYAYAAALVFGPLFFAGASSPAEQTLFALMSFGLAFAARPLGAIAFGHFGDRIGRKATLVMSMLIMGGCTVLIAFLPTYAMASQVGLGWIAPALLSLLRFGQGFGLGGEMAGASLLSIENAPRGWRARFGAAPPLGATAGNFLAGCTFLAMGWLLADSEFVTWGWRLPFLGSAVLVAIALWVRMKIDETPEFRAALARKGPVRIPLAMLLAQYKAALLAGCAAVICPFGAIFLTGPFALAQAIGPLGYDRESFLLVQLLATVVGFVGIVVAARYADRTSPGRAMIVGVAALAGFGLLFGAGLGSGSLLIAAATLSATYCSAAIIMATVGTWLSNLFPVSVRYSGFAVSFNIGGLIGGALFPVVGQMMAAAGWLDYVGLLLSGSAVLTIAAVLLARTESERPIQGRPALAGGAAG